MITGKKRNEVDYFENIQGIPIVIPGRLKVIKSRVCLPLLSFLSRNKSLDLGLTPIDDERVIVALKNAKGRTLDIGCGANNFIRSYGNGLGVDVFPWKGCDMVIEDAAKLPFKKGEFSTISYLACLNHIPNRDRHINSNHELLGMSPKLVRHIIVNAGFHEPIRKRFVFGLNSLYIAKK